MPAAPTRPDPAARPRPDHDLSLRPDQDVSPRPGPTAPSPRPDHDVSPRSDHDAQQTMRAFLTAARLLSEQLGQGLRRESGMSQIHYEVLAWLSETPDRPLRMTELAHRTGVSTSRLSHLVDRLEQRRWVRRLSSADDGRVHLAQLTGAGRRALEDAAPWHAECAQSRLLDHLTAEQLAQLRQISELLRARLTGTAAPSRTPGGLPASRADEGAPPSPPSV
ncbi:MarR family winged helix-turn-helix transcriptional regulator [Streptomyces sp. NPDC014894]|uniref:MarR family winged helix-turn-helix transcriptional regulator n=1 Tax=unclassified Streptomyces TaxID=2593676 RepID=UPI0036F93D9D